MDDLLDVLATSTLTNAVLLPALALLLNYFHIPYNGTMFILGMRFPAPQHILFFGSLTIAAGLAAYFLLDMEFGIRWGLTAGFIRWIIVALGVFLPTYGNAPFDIAAPVVQEFTIELPVMMLSYAVAYGIWMAVRR